MRAFSSALRWRAGAVEAMVGQRDEATGRRGDGETGRRGDGETGRQGDGEVVQWSS